MPRKTQASLASPKNLQKSYKATVEDVPDSDGEESDYFPGDDKKESRNCQQNGPRLEDFFLVLEEEGLACESSECWTASLRISASPSKSMSDSDSSSESFHIHLAESTRGGCGCRRESLGNEKESKTL